MRHDTAWNDNEFQAVSYVRGSVAALALAAAAPTALTAIVPCWIVRAIAAATAVVAGLGLASSSVPERRGAEARRQQTGDGQPGNVSSRKPRRILEIKAAHLLVHMVLLLRHRRLPASRRDSCCTTSLPDRGLGEKGPKSGSPLGSWSPVGWD